MTKEERNSLRALIDRARRAAVSRDLEHREAMLDRDIDRHIRARPRRHRRPRRLLKSELYPERFLRCCWCGARPRGGRLARAVCKKHVAIEDAWQLYLKGELR